MSLHQEQGLQHELVQLLSRWYFEEAKELSINRTWPHIPSGANQILRSKEIYIKFQVTLTF